jgi:hypothetical protein
VTRTPPNTAGDLPPDRLRYLFACRFGVDAMETVDSDEVMHDLCHWLVLGEALSRIPSTWSKFTGEVTEMLDVVESGANYRTRRARAACRLALLHHEVRAVAVHRLTGLAPAPWVLNSVADEFFINRGALETRVAEAMTVTTRRLGARLARWLRAGCP